MAAGQERGRRVKREGERRHGGTQRRARALPPAAAAALRERSPSDGAAAFLREEVLLMGRLTRESVFRCIDVSW